MTIAFTLQKYISMACGMACKCVLCCVWMSLFSPMTVDFVSMLVKNQIQCTVDICGWNTLTEGAVQGIFANRVGSPFKGLIPGPQFWS